MNRSERRRLAKQNSKLNKKSAVGSEAQLSAELITLLEQAIQCQQSGQFDEAESLYRHVLRYDPANTFANHLLGVTLHQKGDPQAAIELIGKALAQDPNNQGMLANLGNAQMAAGRISEAEQTLLHLLDSHENHAGALAGLGNIYLGSGRYELADQTYAKAMEASPGDFVTLGNWGITLHYLERIEEAKDCYRRALVLKPEYVGVLKNLANALMSEGALQDAADIYEQAITLQPDDSGLRINRAMILPVIPSSVEEIDQCRATLVENLEALIARGGNLQEPASQAGVTGFYLAYHARNDVPVMRKITEMYGTFCPRLTWSADPQPSTEGKLRIGFLSHHFHNHTIGKLNRGFIEHFDRSRFEVVVIRTGATTDTVSETIETAADRTIHLPENLDMAQRMVAEEKLDLLFFPDTGMDAFTYYLAYARLAPVQATSWGHPVTTGIANMDYFISSGDLETEEGDQHYTEKLVRLKTPPTYYYRPEKPEKVLGRADFGLPEDANLYLCPQTLFKFHPDYDAVLGEILKADPEGRIVIICGRYANKQRLLCDRFTKAFPDQFDRLIFVPRMPLDKFLQLMLNADVMLDPMFFGGGNTSAEAIAMGIPIVTIAGDYLRDRVTYAYYKAMNFDDLIAHDVEDYVDKAVRLATDKAWHAEMMDKLDRLSDTMFENMKTVRELEQFFVAAIEARRNNLPAINWAP